MSPEAAKYLVIGRALSKDDEYWYEADKKVLDSERDAILEFRRMAKIFIDMDHGDAKDGKVTAYDPSGGVIATMDLYWNY